jgi:gliding motility-associated-like protein
VAVLSYIKKVLKLINIKYMLATMFFTPMHTAQKLPGSSGSTFATGLSIKLARSMSVVVLLLLSFLSKAQTPALNAEFSPAVVCDGNAVLLKASAPTGLPAGVTVTNYEFFYADGGPNTVGAPGVTQVSKIYAPGTYSPYIEAILSNGSRVKSNVLTVNVYHLPRANYTVLNGDTQCFRGNNVCFQNLSTQNPASPSNPIKTSIFVFGDGNADSSSTIGTACHSYSFPSNFTVTLRTIDSLGCEKDTIAPATKPVVIKPNMQPDLSWVMISGPCFVSQYRFTNTSMPPISDIKTYTWDFGDGNTYTATFPYTADQVANYTSILHDYTINGEFPPGLSITDFTGCTDSIRKTGTNIPKNINYQFDIITTKVPGTDDPRDSVCFGSGSSASICFEQTPVAFAESFLWNFDDPPTGPDNVNFTTYTPCHTFSAMGTYYPTLTLFVDGCPDSTFTYRAAATWGENRYIDHYIYENNDLTDPESTPVPYTDVRNKPWFKKGELKLSYLNSFTVLSDGDTLFAYRGEQERPIYHISTDSLVYGPGGVIKDTIIVPFTGSVINGTDTFSGYTLNGYGVRVIGPQARIPMPPTVVMNPNQLNQCGPTDTVDFVNTSAYYKSRMMWRRWDFDDNFAPQCTSFSVPKPGFPPILSSQPLDSVTFNNGKTYVKFGPGDKRGWANAVQQYENSYHYFIANGATYEGIMPCKFSYDSLPRHHYPNWDTVYRWHQFGKDFMPWDPTRYGPGGIAIHPADTAFWGKPVYLNPSTGEWSLVQNSGPAPFGLWTRIDTMDLNINNGQDLDVGEPIQMQSVPDPFNYANPDGVYNLIRGGSIRPTTSISYRDRYGKVITINGSDLLPGSSTMTFYKYAFLRTITRCITVRLRLKDSLNNETTQGTLLDETQLDSVDCNMEATIQLKFAKADGRGMGKSGKECPGRSPDGVINFELGGSGNYPGVAPNCGQSFILMNFDSLADRLDGTPCMLDGFVSYTGGPAPGAQSVTPGGLVTPPFFSQPNYNQIPSLWQDPQQTVIAWHYGLNAPANRPPPADTAGGWVTVGVIIGSGIKDTIITGVPYSTYLSDIPYYGDASGTVPTPGIKAQIDVPIPYNAGQSPVPGASNIYNYQFSQLKNFRTVPVGGSFIDLVDIQYIDTKWPKCVSDTAWYHRFLRIQNLSAKFDVDPVGCRLRHKGEDITVHYEDSTQDDIKYSSFAWGDNTVTVDSFYYAPDSLGLISDGYYSYGVRRVRYNFDMQTGSPVLLDSTVWPVRASGDHQISYYFNATTNSFEPYKTYATDSATTYTLQIPSMVLTSDTSRLGAIIGEYRYNAGTTLGPLAEQPLQWNGTKWVNVYTKGSVVKMRGLLPRILYDTMKYNLNNACTGGLNANPTIVVVDTALMFLPVTHKFMRTSWEAAEKREDATIRDLIHLIGSTRGCFQNYVTPMTIGIIDTLDIKNGDGKSDTVFCENEPVYFVDSLRYWRFDCSVTVLPNNPAVTMGVLYKGGLMDFPWSALQTDSADYWRPDAGDPRVIQDIKVTPGYKGKLQTDVVVPERLYWDFGDGSPIDSTVRPVHRYSSYGRYKVTLVSRDSLGWFDTTFAFVNISKPVAKIGLTKKIFNCGDLAKFIDSSYMETGASPGIDSVKTNFWWFGENKLDTVNWNTRDIKEPVWSYTSNGTFRLKLAVETYEGCKDTGYNDIFIQGPRPYFQLLDPADTIGCAPFTVKVINLADSLGKFIDPMTGMPLVGDTPTRATTFHWGDPGNQQSIVGGRRDTVEFTYTTAGTFVIKSEGSDAPPGVANSCALVFYPDPNNQRPITITVLDLKREVLIDKNIICKDKEVEITNNSDTMYYSYSYLIGDDSNPKIDSVYKSQIAPYKFKQLFTDTGTFRIVARPETISSTLTANAQKNCRANDTVNVRVVTPTPSFTIDTTETPVFHMTNTSDTTFNDNYEWLVRKVGTTTALVNTPYKGSNKDPHFNFDLENDTGTFEVCLTAFAKGLDPLEACQDSVCQTVKVTFTINVEVPNVFSPNGDGVNDVFKIRIEGEQKYKLVIYNRWGAKVFESGEAKTMWNGKTMNEGAECPAGVYYYIFDYQLRSEEDKTRNGTITLIR